MENRCKKEGKVSNTKALLKLHIKMKTSQFICQEEEMAKTRTFQRPHFSDSVKSYIKFFVYMHSEKDWKSNGKNVNWWFDLLPVLLHVSIIIGHRKKNPILIKQISTKRMDGKKLYDSLTTHTKTVTETDRAVNIFSFWLIRDKVSTSFFALSLIYTQSKKKNFGRNPNWLAFYFISFFCISSRRTTLK
jgi:hypothetical protein